MNRPIARTVIAVALLLLGVVALERLPLGYLPPTSSPWLSVELRLPGIGDAEEVARRWLVPLEAEIRGLGRVRAMGGEVHSSGAWLEVLFEPGTDPERKAARLIANLAWLRAELPSDARVEVSPTAGGGDDLVSALWIADRDDRAVWSFVRSAIESVPGVREVRTYGTSSRETRIRIDAAPSVSRQRTKSVRTSLERIGRTVSLGSFERGGSQRPLISRWESRLDNAAAIPVVVPGALFPLSHLARISAREALPQRLARFNGRRGIALLVYKESELSLLEVDRALRRRLAQLERTPELAGKIDVIRDPADGLRALLLQLGIGLLLGTLAMALAGWTLSGPGAALQLALQPSLALCAAANAYWLAGISLHLLSLLALALAVALLCPLAGRRLLSRGPPGVASFVLLAASCTLLPVAVAMSGSALAPRLAEAARSFALAVVAASPTVFLYPPSPPSVRRRRRSAWLFRAALRRSPTVLLVTATACYGVIATCAARVDLRGGPQRDVESTLVLRVALAEGATVEQTEALVERVERRLSRDPALDSFWSLIDSDGATLFAEIAPASRRPDRVRRLKTRLGYALPGGVVTLQSTNRSAPGLRAGSPFALPEIEDRAEVDEELQWYRVVLRGTQPSSLRLALQQLRTALAPLGVAYSDVRSEWGAPSVRIELAPSPGTDPEQMSWLAEELRRRSAPPATGRIPAPTERTWTLVASDGPENGRELLQREDLLSVPLAVAGGAQVAEAGAEAIERVVDPSMRRQSGRFVLPLTILLNRGHPELRRELRARVDRHLALMKWPSGCDLERPSLTERSWTPRRLRWIGIALLLPLLLFAAAACSANSLVVGLGALVPGAVGLAAALALFGSGQARLDELTLFALAAVLCTALPLPLSFFSASRRRARFVAPGYAVFRTLRESSAGILVGTLGLTMMLGVVALISRAGEQPWAEACRVAALASLASLTACLIAVPSLALAGISWSRSDSRLRRQARRPVEWEERSTLHTLAVHGLSKSYPGGVRALDRLSFELHSGIVGLLGPNGAGKTTLIRLLTGLLSPSLGRVSYANVVLDRDNMAAFRQHIGFLPQGFNSYATVTGAQLLEHWAIERGIVDPRQREREVASLLAQVGLENDAGRKVTDYSGGMRRRIGIAVALLADPQILIVDEPTTGLDVESRMRFRETLFRIAATRLILFSTHIPGDVEAVASRLLLLHRGRLRFDGSPQELVRCAEGRVFEAILRDDEISEFTARYRTSTRVRTLDGVRVRAISPPDAEPPGTLVVATLEEAYLAEIDRADREAGLGYKAGRFAFLEAAFSRRASRQPAP